MEMGLSYWRNKEGLLLLRGSLCHNCEELYFPYRETCPQLKCHNEHCVEYFFEGVGTVYSYTVVDGSATPEGYDFAPLILAVVKLREGPKVTAHLTDVLVEELKIDLPVEMVVRRLKIPKEKEIIGYGFAFRPLFLSLPREVSMSSR